MAAGPDPAQFLVGEYRPSAATFRVASCSFPRCRGTRFRDAQWPRSSTRPETQGFKDAGLTTAASEPNVTQLPGGTRAPYCTSNLTTAAYTGFLLAA